MTKPQFCFLLMGIFAIPASEPWKAMIVSWVFLFAGCFFWWLDEKIEAQEEERNRVLEDCLDHLMGAMAKIAQPAHASCGCRPVCSCNSPESEDINADAMRDIAAESIKYVEQYYEPE